MPRVSPRPLKKELEKEITENLWWLFTQFKSESSAEKFFDNFFTDEERLMLAKRLAVFYMLKNGFSYGKISEVLKVTPVTAGKMKVILKYEPEILEIVDRLEKREFKKSVAKNLMEIFKDLGIFKAQGSTRVFPRSKPR